MRPPGGCVIMRIRGTEGRAVAVAVPVGEPTSMQRVDLTPVVDFYLTGLRTEVQRAVAAATAGGAAELAGAQQQVRWLLKRLQLLP